MKSTLLLPKSSRLIPSQLQRELGLSRNSRYTIEDFESLEDWFFFTHIDPTQRIIHAIGMALGLLFFALVFYYILTPNYLMAFITYLFGVFFYYVSGIISHQLYDLGTGRSHPKYLLPTFIPVIKINLATTFKYYDRDLRGFVTKYPFVIEAYELIEIPKDKTLDFLRGRYTPAAP